MKTTNRLFNLKSISAICLTGLAFSMSSQAAELEIELQNLTQSISFTPILVAAHDDQTALFHLGEAATADLQKMAEGGDISDLDSSVTNAGGMTLANPAGGILMAGASASGTLDTGSNMYLSLTAMLLPTNDGFVGLDSWKIPSEAGTYTVMLNGYDAGTEANDEIINGGGASGTPGIPASPDGNAGTGATGINTTDVNTKVHIHPGNIGDSNPTGGVSDVDSRIHRWLNPVAKLIVTVK